jgi:Flp pilus assembly pilin Flp
VPVGEGPTLNEASCSSRRRGLWALLVDESGVTTVEYALIIAILVVGSIACFRGLGEVTGTMACDSAEAMPANSTGATGGSPGAAAPPGSL